MVENTLNELERRVFGVLLEKSLAQPTYYPMTPNAIVAACNQKSNRDPLMDLDEDTVWDTLERLRGRGLVAKVLAPLSMRADRFKHDAREYFGWEKPERAVMAELLLRGPQSIGELKTRCSRMVPFEDKPAVGRVLELLQQADPPLVEELSRTGGRSAARFAHRLYPEGETPAVEAAAVPAGHVPTRAPEAVIPGSPNAASSAASEESIRQLSEQIDGVQSELADLHDGLADLRRRFEAIERQLL
ncbi:MAG: DUF480 domain-containing protein [Planctomycetes bacterium]|nr:DUF480 domain-containing protein [Planctomycetota bacterium]